MHANFKVSEFKRKVEKISKNGQKFQIKYYDKRHNFQSYKVKNRVLLHLTNFVKKMTSINFAQNISVAKYSRRFSYFIVRIVYKQIRHRFKIIRHCNKKNKVKSNQFLMIEFIEKKNNFLLND